MIASIFFIWLFVALLLMLQKLAEVSSTFINDYINGPPNELDDEEKEKYLEQEKRANTQFPNMVFAIVMDKLSWPMRFVNEFIQGRNAIEQVESLREAGVIGGEPSGAQHQPSVPMGFKGPDKVPDVEGPVEDANTYSR